MRQMVSNLTANEQVLDSSSVCSAAYCYRDYFANLSTFPMKNELGRRACFKQIHALKKIMQGIIP